ncbi:FAD-dependent oxidoreductase [Gymnodinialimonas ceratoperidinii]|uniref:GMC family oxidoreductase n=1 Tax=Gymnodinialimonas ceratoperidinii TaxID=2856823 RepID=A0A8F6YAU9_9RHOB|nr:GMC family oxidoreductase [Gymnodinialimonas ceratoperidinii]QXT40314.1 GMC family oxidoreductase [Gymnodinialimonas ceratoperidinii]
MSDADIIIVGSGMGGATLAAGLAASGQRVLILERGQLLADCPEARDPVAIFRDGHFRPDETWLTPEGSRFNPGNYACVGGNSKFYGAVMLRYREADFAPITHMEGTTPGWPFPYETLAPFYARAEALFNVRGDASADPTEPPRGAYPHPPIPHEAEIADLADRLSAAGLHPAPLPLAVDLDRWLQRAQTPWDAFPDTTGGKLDAESAALAEALAHPNVTLRSGVEVRRIEAEGGHVTGLLTSAGRLTAPHVVLAAGAVHTAALLLRSASEAHPRGLANRSDQVGRNFMNHNASAVLALSTRRNRAVYQKTLQINDWYLSGGPEGAPLGNVQLLGRVSAPILAAQTGLPVPLAKLIAGRAIDFYAMSEDLPNPDSRVTLRGEDIVLDWKRSNWAAHEALVAKLKATLKRAGFPVVLSKAFDRRTPSHQCGTARIGTDPATSVCDPLGRAHDLDNLSICDASLLPTSAAVNPSLTIAALALRQADHLKEAVQ